MKRQKRPASTSSTEVRLLPAVIGVGAILFALKAIGFGFEASAASAPSSAPAATELSAPAAAPTSTVETDPLAAINAALPVPVPGAVPPPPALPNDMTTDFTGSGVSSAEMDVLTSLSDRRVALEERQRQLELRANLIAAAEKRVDEKIAQLKAIETTIQSLLGQRDTKELEQLDSLVRIYAAMKPRDAARVFETLDGDVRLNVAGRMKADTMAGIMTALPAEVAQKLTVELANRFKMNPATAAAAAAGSGG